MIRINKAGDLEGFFNKLLLKHVKFNPKTLYSGISNMSIYGIPIVIVDSRGAYSVYAQGKKKLFGSMYEIAEYLFLTLNVNELDKSYKERKSIRDNKQDTFKKTFAHNMKLTKEVKALRCELETLRAEIARLKPFDPELDECKLIGANEEDFKETVEKPRPIV